MNCIKEKKFLFWKWRAVEHCWKIHSISKFMDSSETFHVNCVCADCGAARTDKFVKYDTLILKGFSAETLNKIDSHNWHAIKREIKETA